MLRAAAAPQQRPARRSQKLGRCGDASCIRCGDGDRQRREVGGNRDRRLLHVDRDFDADRPHRRRQRGAHRLLENAERGLRRPDSIGRFRDRAQHLELRARFVDERAPAIDIGLLDLAGDVDHRTAGGQRLDHAAGGVARRGPGAGQRDADIARCAGMCVGHVERARLAARRHEPDPAAPPEGVKHRHVVDRDDAIGGGHATGFEERGDEIADVGLGFTHGIRPGSGRGCRPSPRALPASAGRQCPRGRKDAARAATPAACGRRSPAAARR